MELISVRCTNCGAMIRNVAADQKEYHCTRVGCRATFVVEQAKKFASIEEHEAQSIEKLRKALVDSMDPFDGEKAALYARRILELLPQDFRASAISAICQMKAGRPAPLRELLKGKKPCTQEEFQEVFPYMLSLGEFRDLTELRDALQSYIEEEDVRGGMRMMVDQALEDIRKLDEAYADIPRDVFICYSSRQKEQAMRAVEALEADGNTCWISCRNLRPDAPNYNDEIKRAVRRCRVILVLCSVEAMYSQDVQRELRLAEDAGLMRLELKLDDAPHTSRFRYFFDGITWIKPEGPLESVFPELKERLFALLHAAERCEEGDDVQAVPTGADQGEDPLPKENADVEQVLPVDEGSYHTEAAGPENAPLVHEASAASGNGRREEKPEAARSDPYNVGDVVRFGRYPQSRADADPEPIEWIVLDTEGDKATLISKCALDSVRYNDSFDAVTWKDCALRSWLNDTFLQAAFTMEEQARLETVAVPADRNPEYPADPGEGTRDKVYLLSIPEAERYFSSEEARACLPTACAVTRGAYTVRSTGGKCWWWLRSPGSDGGRAARVHSDGSVDRSGVFANGGSGAVRPVVVLRISDDASGKSLVANDASAKPDGDRKRKKQDAAKGSACNIGDVVRFGRYPQSGADAEPEPIEWIVLDTEGDKATLISKCALDSVRYNERFGTVTWKDCALRSWLNDTFLKAAFTREEQARLETVAVPADRNPEYPADPGEGTRDKVFLLSIPEVERYFSSEEERACLPTTFAVSKGAYTVRSTGGKCWWWLRSLGSDGSRAARVHSDGSVDRSGIFANGGSGAVRPVVVLRLSDDDAGYGLRPNNSSTIPDGDQKTKKQDATSGSAYNTGDVVRFGRYPQSGADAEPEPIEWIVLDTDGKKAALISRYALDSVRYNERFEAVTWKNCTLRKWLNDSFLKVAFTREEQARLETVEVLADRNPEYSTDPGGKTRDKVYLLSIPEAERYFSSDKLRACVPTAYAVSRGAYTVRSTGKCWWWLRTPGCASNNAAYVDRNGAIDRSGDFVSSDRSADRPVIVLRLSEEH